MRDAAMEELVQSVRANGVLSRIIVRPRRAGGYEIIAGHRRSEAARLAGLTEIPAEVRRDLDDDAAVIAMIETQPETVQHAAPGPASGRWPTA